MLPVSVTILLSLYIRVKVFHIMIGHGGQFNMRGDNEDNKTMFAN
jgi:hypothetical protein